MYFPYLRGRKYELLALREIAYNISKSGKCIPIIEPVNFNSSTKKSLEVFRDAKMPFVIIANPQQGKNRPNINEVKSELVDPILPTYNSVIIGYIITENKDIKKIEHDLKLWGAKELCIIHLNSYHNSSSLGTLLKKFSNIKYQGSI